MPDETLHHAEIMRALGRLEGKLDIHMEQQAATGVRHEAAINALYSKTNDHEKKFARQRGVVAGVGALGGLLGAAATLLAKMKGFWT